MEFKTPEIPPFGYMSIPMSEVKDSGGEVATERTDTPPTIDNGFYKIEFASDGALKSVFDKQLKIELVDKNAPYACNRFVFTKDNHKTFTTPPPARFDIERNALCTRVTARTDDPESGASISQTTILWNTEKRIDFDNELLHITSLYNNTRHTRYGYFAFPFKLKQPATLRAMLNGAIVIPQKDVTGHGSDAFLSARDWVGLENPTCGIALAQADSSAVEFGEIHADKTTYGGLYPSGHIYSYIFTDGLQAQIAGGDEINLRFRYSLTSYAGDYKNAKISQFAERFVSPLLSIFAPASKRGDLPLSRSFMSCGDGGISLLAFKQAEEIGGGFVARFRETDGFPNNSANILTPVAEGAKISKISVTEAGDEPVNSGFSIDKFSTLTLRFRYPQKNFSAFPNLEKKASSDNCATLKWSGENSSRFAVFRGDFSGFAPDEFHLAAIVNANEFTDADLAGGKSYFYKVRPITRGNSAGEVSNELEVSIPANGDSPPSKIGSFYTGLITSPRALRGENDGQLYLLWGRSYDSDFAFYELYRSKKSGFEPSEKNFGANIPQEDEYCVGRYVDLGLESHTIYYYRVRAVDKSGRKGDFSPEFQGTTMQVLINEKK